MRSAGPPRCGVSLKAAASPACGPAWVGRWGGGCVRGVRFPTVYSCPEPGPELRHQLSYNLRAKIERGSGPATEPGRMGTGPASEDARAGPDPDLNLPGRQVAPTPQPSVLPSRRTGSQDLRVGRDREQEAPGTLPSLLHQTGGETEAQTGPRPAHGHPV